MPLDHAAGDPRPIVPMPIATLPEADALFIARFRARLDPETAASFTPRQLDAIHLAFALRTLPRHSLDYRRSVPTPWGRTYLAIIAGREKRGQARRHAEQAIRGAGLAADIALFGIVALVLIMLGAGGLYLAKMGLSIDLFPGIDMLDDKALRQLLEG
jgi:hypothetical protein